ncbi:unnamed protein product [Nesidiocoris tenuis]|uniref:Integrase catalytic domain-containing protein n=1 Tax=Nesidiocoris tenuis TaxID=355587 RepID=A0A6H5H512_9HEMI|nr:unnamed protein product [Nesidiocoris tenuis]
MSRFTFVLPLTKATSETIIKSLQNKIFCHFGFWERIVSDNATCFTSKKFTDFLFLCGIKHTLLPPHYPNPNLAERQIQNLKSSLRSQCADDHSKWAAKLHLTQISLNSAINETTKFTPAELFLGRNISTPLNFMWGVSEKELDLPHTWTTAINNIHREHSRYAKFYNRKHTNVTYAVGDHVYLKTHILSDKIKRITHKLAPKYYGPFTIIKLLSPVTYVLQDTKNPNLVKTAHVSQLKIAREQRRAPS